MRLLTIILILAAQLAIGQAPGYMGRKLLISSEVSFFNAFFNPNHNFSEGIRKFGFNLRATTDIDYVIARNGTIGATFDVIATGMKFNWKSDQFNELLIPNIDQNFGHSRITGYGYGINYKLFRNPSRGGIAPIGSYIKFDIMLLDVRLRPYNLTTETAHSYSNRFFTPAFSFTLGQQRIFWDFFILRTGIQLGFVPMGISPYLQEMGDGIERGTQEQDLRANAESRLLTYYLLNINVGVGFLLPFRNTYKSTN
ncbi:MAG: hypothetical protein K9G46_02070 [Flavobacteriales bacterium]|nr:hypothetical protein [Flavobacteriales bacterium]